MIRRWPTVALLFCAMLLAAPVAAMADAVADEGRFVELINESRRQAGAAPLVIDDTLVEAARAHSNWMADEGRIFHNPDLDEVAEGWSTLGENVGRGGDVESLHAAFMASDGHRANLLNPIFDKIGVGVVWSDGTPYVTEVFMDSADEVALQFSPPFLDDDGSVHEANIVELWKMGITRGCADDRYCPDRGVRRAELATMLVRAFDLSGTSPDVFSDIDETVHREAISVLAANDVTRGCAPNRFCPDQVVSRAEMATFLTRLLDLPAAGSAGFEDTRGSVHAGAIDSLSAAGITRGCSTDRFCPEDPVTRAQFASFLVRALSR